MRLILVLSLVLGLIACSTTKELEKNNSVVEYLEFELQKIKDRLGKNTFQLTYHEYVGCIEEDFYNQAVYYFDVEEM